ncbi:MAG: hypothetical protein OXC07_02890 [Kistimonas sp.]|nr:hypothetical protein [Kistimonas sp.]
MARCSSRLSGATLRGTSVDMRATARDRACALGRICPPGAALVKASAPRV